MLLLTMSHNFFHHCLFYRFFLFSQKFVVPFSLTQMQVALLQLQKSIEKTSYVLLTIKILNLPIIDLIQLKYLISILVKQLFLFQFPFKSSTHNWLNAVSCVSIGGWNVFNIAWFRNLLMPTYLSRIKTTKNGEFSIFRF